MLDMFGGAQVYLVPNSALDPQDISSGGHPQTETPVQQDESSVHEDYHSLWSQQPDYDYEYEQPYATVYPQATLEEL